ncbi:MAG: hypothetical protein U9R68_07035, partial [Planctomycetota bacterium]|nr:hypothetical protein [Planctomycetota bacterium]
MATLGHCAGWTVRLCAAGLVLSSMALGAEPPGRPPLPSIVPRPARMRVCDGTFRFTPGTRVIAGGRAAREAAKLIDALAPAMGFRLKQ